MTDKLNAPLFVIGQRVYLRGLGWLGTVTHIVITGGEISYRVRWGSESSMVSEGELEAAE